MSERPRFTTIDDYFETASPEALPILQEIRELVPRLVPAAQETISYQMPAFRLKRVFFFFAAFKKHIGIYPPVNGDDDLMQALQPYSNEKGNLKFPLNQPMPYDLIGRVIETLARQDSE
ncbi:MAG: DUF1801 domain-containing protein [Caldilineales bacterium]|nr:DUF1801 domain-containing protein [Caldilineales bacterium]